MYQKIPWRSILRAASPLAYSWILLNDYTLQFWVQTDASYSPVNVSHLRRRSSAKPRNAYSTNEMTSFILALCHNLFTLHETRRKRTHLSTWVPWCESWASLVDRSASYSQIPEPKNKYCLTFRGTCKDDASQTDLECVGENTHRYLLRGNDFRPLEICSKTFLPSTKLWCHFSATLRPARICFDTQNSLIDIPPFHKSFTIATLHFEIKIDINSNDLTGFSSAPALVLFASEMLCSGSSTLSVSCGLRAEWTNCRTDGFGRCGKAPSGTPAHVCTGAICHSILKHV